MRGALARCKAPRKGCQAHLSRRRRARERARPPARDTGLPRKQQARCARLRLMRRFRGTVGLLLLLLPLLVPLLVIVAAPAQAARPEQPRLILLVVMDQFRQDYLTRFRSAFLKTAPAGAAGLGSASPGGSAVSGGLNLLLEGGAVFANCHYRHALTVTAPGHATLATGASPNVHGIISNGWFDRVRGQYTTAGHDPATKLLGATSASAGASPRWLIGSTLGDQLHRVTKGRARIISISYKARSAVFTAGKQATAAYWLDPKTLSAISSTYYMRDLPDWVRRLNVRDWVAQYGGKPWTPVDDSNGKPFLIFPKATNSAERVKLVHAIRYSPFLTDIEFALARAAVEHEQLGRGPATDLLVLNPSAIDLVGHVYGPDARQTRDAVLRADRGLAKFLQFLEQRIGLRHVWIAVSADHGVAPMPEQARREGRDAGRVSHQEVVQKIESRLRQLYPASLDSSSTANPKWVVNYPVPHLYLNQALIRERRLSPNEVARRAAEALLELPGLAAVFTRADLIGCRPGPELPGKVCRSYHPDRGGDLYLVFKRYWMNELPAIPKATTHGSPYDYDTHVPLILWGHPFRAGTYEAPVSPADLPVTLAAALGIRAPSLATGRVLTEALKRETRNPKSDDPRPVH